MMDSLRASKLSDKLQNDPNCKNILDKLSKQEIQSLRNYMAQKISDNTMNKIQKNEKRQSQIKQQNRQITCIQRFCCCFLPQFFLLTRTYQPYFNVTTQIVINRIKNSIIIWNGQFLAYQKQHFQLYGPFWISITLAFIISLTGNLQHFFANITDTYNLDLGIIGTSFSTVLFTNQVLVFAVLMPLILYFIIKCLNGKATLLGQLCLYGYSTFHFIPFCIISMVPISVYKNYQIIPIISISIACLINAIFLARNHYWYFDQELGKSVWALILTILFFQVALFCTLKFTIYNATSISQLAVSDNVPLDLKAKHFFTSIFE